MTLQRRLLVLFLILVSLGLLYPGVTQPGIAAPGIPGSETALADGVAAS